MGPRPSAVFRRIGVSPIHGAATFFTLIESCKRADHNTFDYLHDFLRRIGDHYFNRLDELLPDRWQPRGGDT